MHFRCTKLITTLPSMKKKKVKLRDLGSKERQGENVHESGHNHGGPEGVSKFKTYLPAIFSFVMLIIGIAVDYFDAFPFFKGWIRIAWYTLAYLPVGFPVIKEG